jgi:UPF0755 protein
LADEAKRTDLEIEAVGMTETPPSGKAPAHITPKSPRAALEPENIPAPPRRSRSARHPFVIAGNAIITILLLGMVGAGALFVYGKQRIEAPGPLAEDKIVNIPARAGLGDIADLLQREGVIEPNRLLFFGGVIAMKARSELKSGEYLFGRRASLHDVIETMVEGKVVQHSLTVPEGLTSEQIVARMLDSPVLAGSVTQAPREGTMLPETYKFTRGTTREQLIQRMQQAQRRLVQEIWDRRNAEVPIRSPEQLVALASIIEKETSRTEERTRVAAVFVNRLRQRIKLQSDPTIIYGMVGGKGTLGRPIKRSEIHQPSPYNTYVIDGLPPGPIANPGRASLEAAANPARTRDLFFVADGSGGHAFSETYDAHRRNVAKLRGIEKRQRIDALEDDDDEPDAAPTSAAPAGMSTPAARTPAAAPKQGAPAAAPKMVPKMAPKAAAQAKPAALNLQPPPPPKKRQAASPRSAVAQPATVEQPAEEQEAGAPQAQ